MSTPGAGSGGRIMAVISAGIVLVNLDLFIVNVALPDIAADLGGDPLGGLSWVLNGYAIVYAALLVLLGRIADRYDRRDGFLLGVIVFVLASAACGLATSQEMLIAFRVVQAVGAALLTPTSLALVLATSTAENRQSRVRTWTAIGGLGAALGPVAGGILVAASWRWVFLVNVPIGIAALVAGVRVLPRVPGHAAPHPDALSAAMVTGGIGALTLALVEGGRWGWGSPTTIGVLLAAGLTLAAFVRRCREHANPLVPPALFRVPAYTGAAVVVTFFMMAFGAMLLSIVLWEQQAWEYSALKTGLSVAPGPLMVPFFSFFVAGRAIARFGPGAVCAVGSTVFAAGAGWWALQIGLAPAYASSVLPGILMTGVGVGLTLPTCLGTAAAALPPQSFATGSAVINMLRQIGLAIGVAVLIAIVGTSTVPAERLDAFQHGWTAIALASLASAVAATLVLSRRALRPATAPVPAVAAG